MTYGFKIVQEMITGLRASWTRRAIRSIEDFRGRAVPNVTDWQYLNLNYVAKAEIDQDLCIKCGRCHIVCEDTSHQAIFADGQRRRASSSSTTPNASAAISACWSARSRTASRWCTRPKASIRARACLRPAAGELDGASEQSGGVWAGGGVAPYKGRRRSSSRNRRSACTLR